MTTENSRADALTDEQASPTGIVTPLTMVIVSYGGGTDSTAMLGLMERIGIRPDQITFADTGSEKPHTYEYIKLVNEWCKKVGFPEIEIVRWIDRQGRTRVLHQDCLDQKTLPSVCFGFKGCSTKYKIQPQERRDREDPRCQAVWAAGGLVDKFIGYEAGEERRMRGPDEKYRYHYPLIDHGLEREDCIDMITGTMGLPRAGKSACFCCGNSKKAEVAQLKRQYPVLFQTAIRMERNAVLTSVKGLGRSFAWGDLKDEDVPAYEPDHDMPCGCYE
ncbi:phosphoadenosine phosphosulfate reductase family protein [Burkholderia sp. BCC1644]|uniref:phosphoadenosine phosphosulfate reductase domain-containing protein n=1 Tax=Burkholderia sp. BCC1644 TaxID=2676293 RepID=UPI0015902329|nr:phosphoadenosine phosphosulfate reductase family protein [Burkholderia sp. BCC1644]